MDKIIELFKQPEIAAVFSGLGTLLLTGLFGFIRAKNEQKNLFFERYFPKRINAYNSVLRKFQKTHKELSRLIDISPDKRAIKLAELTNNISMNYFKNILWLDLATKNVIVELCSFLKSTAYEKDKLVLIELISDPELDIILKTYAKMYALIYKSMEASSGVLIINKKIHQLLRPIFFKRLYRKISGHDKKKSEKFERFIYE